jgi:hypothetical protein
MEDVQNIPPPDVNSVNNEDDFGSHSDYPDVDKTDVENPDVDDIPIPPDSEPAYPVEEPPSDVERPPVEEDQNEPKQIV